MPISVDVNIDTLASSSVICIVIDRLKNTLTAATVYVATNAAGLLHLSRQIYLYAYWLYLRDGRLEK